MESPGELNCLGCHSPTGGARDIKTPLAQSYRHDVHLTTRVHDEAESSISMQEHVECEDCHNPHALLATTSVPPGANGSLQGVKGVGAGGEMKETVSFQYEVCFKCHADKNFSSTVITRQVPSLNTRLEFSLDNPAYHPVMGPGKVTSVQSLRTDLGYSTSSVIYCTDCHNSDQSAKAGGTGPNGPHGSSYKYILIDNYDTGFYPMPYSDSNYALCYRCHSQAKLMATTSPFSAVDLALHQVHTVQKGVPCFICHDPHGSSLGNNATEENNAHLINFVTDFKIVATYNLSTKSCTSSCHSNNPRSYGEFASGAGRGLLKTRKPAQRPF